MHALRYSLISVDYRNCSIKVLHIRYRTRILTLQTGKKHTQNNTYLQGGKCALHPDGNHSTADCKKLRNLQLHPFGNKGGRGRGMYKDRGGKGREKGKPSPNWTPKGKGGKGGKGKP